MARKAGAIARARPTLYTEKILIKELNPREIKAKVGLNSDRNSFRAINCTIYERNNPTVT